MAATSSSRPLNGSHQQFLSFTWQLPPVIDLWVAVSTNTNNFCPQLPPPPKKKKIFHDQQHHLSPSTYVSVRGGKGSEGTKNNEFHLHEQFGEVLLVCQRVGELLFLSCLLAEHRSGTPPTQVRVPGAARDFSPRVNFPCRLSYGVRTPPCAVACIDIRAYVKGPNIFVWIVWTHENTARTVRNG